ncbi:MAG: hypothetical protein ACR2FJ_04545 [Qipengyuania sp.]
MRLRFFFSAGLLALFGACGSPESEAVSDTESEAPGSYAYDPQTGETRASIRQDDGRIATMRSGESVPVDLPGGFTLYPGAQVESSTQIDSVTGGGWMVRMTSREESDRLVEFYRREAQRADIDLAMNRSMGDMTIIGGDDGKGLAFIFTARHDSDRTHGHLTLSREAR